MTCESTLIASGDSLDISIDWGETAQLSGAPDTVAFQVFDFATGVAVSGIEYATPSAITAFVVDGQYLVSTDARRRRMRVQVVALFGDERKTVFVDVFVERVFSMVVVPGDHDDPRSADDTIPYFTIGQALALDGIGV